MTCDEQIEKENPLGTTHSSVAVAFVVVITLLDFVAIRASITRCTLTKRLIILISMTNASIVTNECRTGIDRTITMCTFITSMTFASITSILIDTCPIVTRDMSTRIFTQIDDDEKQKLKLKKKRISLPVA